MFLNRGFSRMAQRRHVSFSVTSQDTALLEVRAYECLQSWLETTPTIAGHGDPALQWLLDIVLKTLHTPTPISCLTRTCQTCYPIFNIIGREYSTPSSDSKADGSPVD